MQQDDTDPATALSLANTARKRIAARADVPNWYGWCYGIFCGLLVTGGGLGNALGMSMVAVGISGLVVIYRTWVDRTGIEVNGYRAGRTRTIATLLAIVLVALMLGGMGARLLLELPWAPYATGIIGAICAIIGGYAWDRAWKAELRSAR
ncbi:MAG: hypothetical protein KF780_11295 [Sphingomonas sp.]|nr:hypothetical protein [Sphingomonas sp.]